MGFALPLILPSKIAMSLFAQALFDALLATSVGFLVLQNGRISFGQAAFSGLGGYAFGVLVARGLVGSEVALLIALLLPTLVAFLLGLVIARVSGVAHAMLTLAVGQAFYEVAFRWRELAKGDDGMSFDLPARMFGLSSRGLQDPAFMVVLAWSILVVVLVALALFARSRIGMVTAAIRDNEERARFLGYSTTLPRALVYALAAFIAAIAGILQASYNGYIAPQMFHWTVSGYRAHHGDPRRREIHCRAGGRRRRPVLRQGAGRTGRGVLAGDRRRRARPRHPDDAARHHRRASSSLAATSAAMTQVALEGVGLTRQFGGFVALDGVNIALKRGEIRGLIGPNGAGKSTLIDVLSGRAKNRRGRVMLNGEDVSELSPQQRRKRGMARSFQRTNIFPELTVEQQLRVASWAVADADIAEVIERAEPGRSGRPVGRRYQLRRSAPPRSCAGFGWPAAASCCSTSRPRD